MINTTDAIRLAINYITVKVVENRDIIADENGVSGKAVIPVIYGLSTRAIAESATRGTGAIAKASARNAGPTRRGAVCAVAIDQVVATAASNSVVNGGASEPIVTACS